MEHPELSAKTSPELDTYQELRDAVAEAFSDTKKYGEVPQFDYTNPRTGETIRITFDQALESDGKRFATLPPHLIIAMLKKMVVEIQPSPEEESHETVQQSLGHQALSETAEE